jgi:hypothetical protein
VTGNGHARFLGGRAAATPLLLPGKAVHTRMRTDGEGPQPLGMSRNKGTQRTRKLSTENARWMLRKWEGRLLTYARRWTKGGEPDAVKAASPVRRRG